MADREAGQAAITQPWGPSLWRRATSRAAERNVAATVALRAVVLSRLIVWAAALEAMSIFGRNSLAIMGNDPLGYTEPFNTSLANFLFAPAARWDSVWYLEIAHAGYFSRASSAFFPLYPLLLRFGGDVVGSLAIAGLLISLGSFLVAMYLLYLLVRLEIGDRAARTTLLLLAFFPTSLFFSAIYTESLFLMLSVGAVYAARRDRWVLASVLGCLCAATRSNGILIAVPLVLMYLYGPRALPQPAAARQWWRPRYRISWSSLWFLLVPVGLIAYLGYLYVAHDAPLAPFQVQQQLWRHEFAGPFGAIVTLIVRLPTDVHRIITHHQVPFLAGDPLSWTMRDLVDIPFLVFALAGLYFSWRRLPFAYFAYGFVYIGYVLASPTTTEALQGFSRYLVIAFPLFMGWGAWLSERRITRAAALSISTALLVVFSAGWGVWAWIG